MILHLLNYISENSDQRICPELNIFNVDDGRNKFSSTTIEDSLLKECWTFEMLRKLQERQYGTMYGNGECMIHNVVTTQQTITFMEPDLLHYLTFLVCTEIGMEASRCKFAEARALGKLITGKGQPVPRRRSTGFEGWEQALNNEAHLANIYPGQHAGVYERRTNSLSEQIPGLHRRSQSTICSVKHCLRGMCGKKLPSTCLQRGMCGKKPQHAR